MWRKMPAIYIFLMPQLLGCRLGKGLQISPKVKGGKVLNLKKNKASKCLSKALIPNVLARKSSPNCLRFISERQDSWDTGNSFVIRKVEARRT